MSALQASGARPRIVIVPGLRGVVPEHWQARLASRLPGSVSLTPLGRENLDLAQRVAQVDQAVHEAQQAGEPVLLVAHSGGCITVAHWAARSQRTGAVIGALLATPPDFERPLPPEYPTLPQFQEAGWLPVPRQALGFRSIVAASRNDPLGAWTRVAEMAQAWGSELVDLGQVGHLNPASGFGEWPQSFELLVRLLTRAA